MLLLVFSARLIKKLLLGPLLPPFWFLTLFNDDLYLYLNQIISCSINLFLENSESKTS